MMLRSRRESLSLLLAVVDVDGKLLRGGDRRIWVGFKLRFVPDYVRPYVRINTPSPLDRYALTCTPPNFSCDA